MSKITHKSTVETEDRSKPREPTFDDLRDELLKIGVPVELYLKVTWSPGDASYALEAIEEVVEKARETAGLDGVVVYRGKHYRVR